MEDVHLDRDAEEDTIWTIYIKCIKTDRHNKGAFKTLESAP